MTSQTKKFEPRRMKQLQNKLLDRLSGIDAKVFLNALIHDSDANVAIADYDGNLLFCNDVMQKRFSVNDLGSANVKMYDIFPISVAEERIRYIRSSYDSGKNMTLYGMLNGVYHRTTFLPLGFSDNLGLREILIVCNPITNENYSSKWLLGRDCEVLYAECQDMGSLSNLTITELEVLKLIGSGMTNIEIAKELHKSDKTIERYRGSLGRILGIKSRIDLAHIARSSGLLHFDISKLRQSSTKVAHKHQLLSNA